MIAALTRPGGKTGILLAAMASVSASNGVDQDQLDRYRTQMANQGAPVAPTAATPTDAGIAATIAQWRALQQTDALSFDSYAGFLTAHPGWPGEASTRRAAEKQAGTGSPGSVVAYFRRFPPQTSAGGAAFARALDATGAHAEAVVAARTAWRRGALSPTDEAYLQVSFGTAFTPADQDARMDALLWSGQTGAAARQLAFVSPDRIGILGTRLKFRADAPEAAEFAASTQDLYRTDPGYVADRAIWLRNNNAGPAARSWLARQHSFATPPGDPAKWYQVLLTNAQGANADGQYQLAYDIARQVDDAYPAGTDVSLKSYAERDAYTDLVWLAGQAALKKLGRPADAFTMFDRYGRGSQSPQTRAKGFYWAARAAEAAGRPAEATQFLERAATYRDQFYGQLATERLGRRLVPPPPVGLVAIAPADRATFDGREVVRVTRFLGGIGDWQDQTPFVKQIALDAKTATDHLLATQLALEIHRPDLGVMVGRSAAANGLGNYSASGFPTVNVPAGYEDSWTMVHAIARQESQFDRMAVSHAGARGLMQLMPGTAREQSGKLGLPYSTDALTADPNLSIQIGASYFQRIYMLYGSYPLAIAAYNAGGGNVNRWLAANGDPRTGQVEMVDWIEAIPFGETRNYVERVLENAVVYDLMNAPRAKSKASAAPLSWYLGKGRPG
ncbi:lytic transglycosylase domain-containing protein [uncultured Sphingomonas sp.]|uniref:lytic transglycosylase domain-containing protein n=1 Tax=uncultured Sphingomonas sp. TaxID=158754 RepID=UPI0035CA8484